MLLLAIVVRYIGINQAPNQQIVVKFSNAAVADAVETTEKIKLQLEHIGATDIKTETTATGNLRITYYSTTGIDEIRHEFSKQSQLKLVYSVENESSNKHPRKVRDYELNISHIQNYSNKAGDFNGKAIVEAQQKSDRSQDHKTYKLTGFSQNYNFLILGKKQDLETYKTIVLVNHRSHIIPESRAGPLS